MFKYVRSSGEPIAGLAFIGDPAHSGAAVRNIKMEIGNKETPYIPNSANIQRIPTHFLVETVCPGEFYPFKDGSLRQMYSKTWVGTTPDPEPMLGIILTSDVIDIIPIQAYGTIDGLILFSNNYHILDPSKMPSTLSIGRKNTYGLGDIIIHGVDRGGTPYPKGLPYTITIKYIKD